jgi:hypothetical protein
VFRESPDPEEAASKRSSQDQMVFGSQATVRPLRPEGPQEVRFGKDSQVHEAMTYLAMYSPTLCWQVRTLRIKEVGRCQERSPAPAAGFTDHVWTWEEWSRRPAGRQSA